MTRDAIWRRRPEDPRTAWQWIVRRDNRLRWVAPRGWPKVIGFYVLGIVLLGLMDYIRGREFLSNALVLIPLLATIFIQRRRVDAAAHAALPTLIESPGAPRALPVAMVVRAEGKTTGKDRGWLSVAEGWLVFEGLRTTVALKSRSVVRVTQAPEGMVLWLADGRAIRLCLLVDAKETTLPASRSARSELAWTIDRWHNGFSPEGDAIVPPQTLHPEVVGDELGRLLAGCIIGVLFTAFTSLAGTLAWALPFALSTAVLSAFTLSRLLAFRKELSTMIEGVSEPCDRSDLARAEP